MNKPPPGELWVAMYPQEHIVGGWVLVVAHVTRERALELADLTTDVTNGAILRYVLAPGQDVDVASENGSRHPSQSVTAGNSDRCLECSRPLGAGKRARVNRRYCSGRCRTLAWRRRRAAP